MKLERPLGYLLGQTCHLYKLKVAERFKHNKFNLNFDDFVMLYIVNEKKELTQQDIANHFQKDKSMILRKISNLIEKNYVNRMQDKEDKRKKNLLLTLKGEEALQFSEDIALQLSQQLLKGIRNEEIETTYRVLEKIQKNTGLYVDQCSGCSSKL